MLRIKQELDIRIGHNKIYLGDPSRAGVIVPAEQKENEDVLMLIMPLLLND